MAIKINEEIKSLIPPLAEDERKQLEANLIADGCRDPLVVWDDVLIDGHNRFEICTRLGIEFKTIEKEFSNRSDVVEWIIRNQFGRRNLTPYVRTQLALRLEAEIAGKAKANQVANLKTGTQVPVRQNSDKRESIDTKKEIAKIANVSHDTVARVKVIEQRASDEIKQQLATGELSINQAYGEIRREEKQKFLDEKKAEIIRQTKDETSKNPPKIFTMDCVDFLRFVEPYDLLLTDPPYSTDVDDIAGFAQSWLPLALQKLKPTGRAYVFIGAYPEELQAYLNVAMPDQILVWTYRNTLGPSPKNNYKLNWQAILYYKGEESGPLDCPIMMEQFSVQDISAPDGRQANRYHAWQKPIEIAQRFIRHSTKQGDVVCDPFACTGTFLLAASQLDRVGIGCDISEENIKIATERGCKHVEK